MGGAPYNNPKYIQMINKCNYRKTLKNYSEYLPCYYAMIKDGMIECLDSWPADLLFEGTPSIFQLLEEKKALAFKLAVGRAGKGFIVARYVNKNEYWFNDNKYSYDTALRLIEQLNGYLISEFVQQCDAYRKIWDRTAHTLRVQTCNIGNGKAEVVFSFLRFGSSKALHAVNHIIDPGIFTAIIDIDTGHTIKIITSDVNRQQCEVEFHPDTDEFMKIDVPNWALIISKCKEMHDFMPELAWLGWDIMVTNEGFKILEINTFSGLVAVESVEPIMTSSRLKPIFSNLLNMDKTW